MAKTQSSRRIHYSLQLISALAATLLSLYLLYQHTRLKTGIQDSASFCSLSPIVDCDVVNASQYSEILGVSLASYGAFFFFVLFVLALLGPPKSPFFPRTQQTIAWLSLLGILVDSFLLIIQVFAIRSICLVCLLTYVLGFLILISSVQMANHIQGNWIRRLSWRLVPGGNPPLPSLSQASLSALSVVCFLGVVSLFPSFIRINSQTYSLVNDAISQFFASWKGKKLQNIDWKETDGTFGNPNAPVQIVEFSDFECPYCHKAAFTLHTALRPLKDQIFFVFKNFPLDSECNPAVSYRLHPTACHLARLAYCARKKNQFWEYHDKVFLELREEDVKKGMEHIKKGLASIFTEPEVDECLNSQESLDGIAGDIELGESLGIKGTPSVFINGKLITIPLTVESLRRLVQLETSLAQ